MPFVDIDSIITISLRLRRESPVTHGLAHLTFAEDFTVLLQGEVKANVNVTLRALLDTILTACRAANNDS